MATYYFSQIHTFDPLITLAEAKAQLKLEADFTAEDDLIQMYIDAAIINCENYTNTSLNEAKFIVQTTTQFENNLKLNVSPVQSIDSITYKDTDENPQTLDPALYELKPYDKFQSIIYFTDFENIPEVTEGSIEIAITTGYTAATLPLVIKQAAMLTIGGFYENRQDAVENLPKASTNLLRAYRFYF